MAHVRLFVPRNALQERKLLQDFLAPLPIAYVTVLSEFQPRDPLTSRLRAQSAGPDRTRR